MNAEKKTSLVDLIESSGFPILLEVIEELLRIEETKLLRYDLQNGDAQGLLVAKCEADGARKLANAIKGTLQTSRVVALKTKK